MLFGGQLCSLFASVKFAVSWRTNDGFASLLVIIFVLYLIAKEK